MFEALRDGDFHEHSRLESSDNRKFYSDPGSWRKIAKRFRKKQAVGISVSHSQCALLPTFLTEARTIPKELRGDYEVANGMFIRVGPHDIFECVENDRGQLFGRAELSVMISSYFCPNNWVATRAAVLDLPIVKETQAKLSTILPDLQTCVFWDI
ncbi:MAG: hypothetical protein R3B46_13755 [Phycisphaerales bacterium]|nr:hypothetical protein [Phycisphaerales bacterium]